MGQEIMTDKKKKHKRYIRRIVGIVTLAAVLFVVLGTMDKYVLMKNDNVTRRVNGFYLEDKDSLDFVVLGASEVAQGFAPAEAYIRHGLTSYSFTVDGNPMSLYKYELKEILNRQKPQALVVEVNGALYGDGYLHRPGPIRMVTDSMKDFGNKRELINDLCRDDKLSHYIPLVKYHSRWPRLFNGSTGWKELVAQEERGYTLFRGFLQYANEKDKSEWKPVLYDAMDDDTSQDIEKDCERCLREFLDECRESGIEHVLFVRFPHRLSGPYGSGINRMANRVGEIVTEYGYDFINMNQKIDDIGFDMDADFRDAEHLNLSGAIKTTDYISDYLVEKYNINPVEQTEEQKEGWDNSAEYFRLLNDFWDKRPTKKGEKGWIKYYGDSIETVEALDKFAKEK